VPETYNATGLVYNESDTTYDGEPYGPLPFPIAGVFIAWNDGPYVANPAWTEITNYVRAISTRRGRSDDFEQFDTGTAQLVLDNRARTFDPFYDPGVLRTNLLPNPSFETDTTGWTPAGVAAPTIARTTAEALFGSASLSITATVAANGGAVTPFGAIPVTAGLTYTASIYVKSAATVRFADIVIQWVNSSGTIFSSPNGPDATTSTTGWTRASFTAVAPAGAVQALIFPRVLSMAIGEVHYFDGIMFEQASTVGTYFDGTTFPSGEMGTGITSWTGTPDASTSQLNQFPGKLRLTPRRQIRIVGQANGVNYDIFRGFVAGWPVTWTDAGYDSTVTIQAFDALGLMAGEVVPTDWPYTYTTSLNPDHYWRFDEAQPVAAIEDEIAGWNLTQIPAFSPIKAFENPTLGVGLTAGSLFCAYWGFGPTTSTYSGSMTFSGWVQLSAYNEFPFRSAVTYKDGNQTISIGSNGNKLSVAYYAATGTTEYYRVYDVPAAFGTITTPFHFAATLTPNAGTYPTGTLYINGSAITLPAPTTSSTAAGYTASGSMTMVYSAAQELTAYRRILTAAEIQNLYDYGSGRIFETTSSRMSRLINTTEWSPTLTSFTATPAASVSEIGTGTGVVPEMQLVADSEGGDLYVSKAGVLTMTNRTDVFNAPRSSTPQATITDSGAGLGYGTELQIDYDADSLSNDVTVTFSGNGEVNAYSDAVIEAYGAAATTIETQLADPTSASQLATRQLGVQGSLVPRISPIDLSVNTSQTDWQTILGLELLDRVTFKRTPTVGNQFSREALVNAIEHTIEPGSWSTSVQLSMRYTSPLILDDDVLGTLDFNYLG
jgi:hypothetical protein